MLIQLRQSEIEIALREYIVNQGISLTGRQVDISFTSGRKDNGISAELDIVELNQTAKVTHGFEPTEVVKDSCPVKDPEEATDETDFHQDTEEDGVPVKATAASSLFG